MNTSVNLGATLQEDSRGEFLVWAPTADTVDVQIVINASIGAGCTL